MNKAVVFAGGLPYGPDLKALDEAFPVPQLTEGRLIGHEEIEAVLRLTRNTSRYRGVMQSWINQQRNSNRIHIEAERGAGFIVLDPASLLSSAEKGFGRSCKQLIRKGKRFAWVERERLDETGKKRLDNDVRFALALSQEADKKRRELAIDLAPVKSLPKPKLVREAS